MCKGLFPRNWTTSCRHRTTNRHTSGTQGIYETHECRRRVAVELTALQFWWLCEPIFIICNMAIKASIGIMLLRLSVNRTHRMILYINLAVTQLYSVFFFFVFLFQCVPSQYFWTRFTGGEGTCMPANIVVSSFYGYSAVACVTDWVFSILPCFLVWNLQMGRREKASVILILATGAL